MTLPTNEIKMCSNRLIRRAAAVVPLLLILGGMIAKTQPAPLPERAAKIVDYHIKVKLDPKKRQLHGNQRLIWRNTSTDTVGDLWFHLYLNAFKDRRSTFFKESGGQLRGDFWIPGAAGHIEILSIKSANGHDLKPGMSFESPDDGNPDDQTVCRVELAEPLKPGESVDLRIEFLARLPEVFARTGYSGDFYMVGQWFPKIGVYEPAGMRGRKAGGWNCHQFHAHSEFYANFGKYRVEINAPKRFVLGATGELRETRDLPDGTRTHVFEQEDVHDFAWTADPDYVVVKRRFVAEREVSEREYAELSQLLGRPVDQLRLSDVEINLLIQPDHTFFAERYAEATRLTLKWFGLWYGRYPYRTITLVDPGATGAGGMEYPTLFTGGTHALLAYWPLTGFRYFDMVAVHEAGHQWWHGMVANNEFEEAWLDEGINSYSTGRVIELAFGKRATIADMPGFKLGEVDMIRAENGPNMKFDRIIQPSWTYLSDYGFYAYTKPELALFTLENLLGEKTMARIMRTFHERWRFGHPGTADFIAVANEVSGQDLNWFFNSVFHGTDVLDYEVSEISATRVSEREDRGPKSDRNSSNGQQRPTTPRKSADFSNEFVVRRLGEVVFPVEVQAVFEDGKQVRQTWDGKERWKKFSSRGPSRIVRAEVDPDRKVLLDVDWSNNSRLVTPDPRAARRLAGGFLFWVESALSFVFLMAGI